ncbi:MAG TPA: C39 family peptidase, partial [Bacteroidota bacterium]|nr:C39 family peptidase [Bacteroidota bacterium]
THPAQDTTIVLTQENQPILTLQEEHTPSSGKFEPMISWEPSETITTAEYFEQIQDSLVITVKVRARNIAEMEAVDSVRITLKKNVLDHFAVRVERDTVAFTETSKIFVQGKDARDNDIDPPADTKVNIVLRVDERYGNLAYKSTVGKEVIDVPYSDAKSGQVVFAATGENPIGLEPQKVDVGVTGLGKEGVGSVWVKSNFVKYCQTNSAWANLPYDSYKELDEKGNVKQPERQYTIKDKGCALTAMAMVLKAVGLDYDPKKLNEEMTKDGLFGKHPKTGNWDGGVEWTAVTEYGSAKLKPDPVPIGTQQNWNSKTPIALSSLDSYLRSGAFVIVLVGNPDRRDPTQLRNHWVLVTGNEGGKYKILDPGCYQGRTTLDSYGNVIYRAIIYERK